MQGAKLQAKRVCHHYIEIQIADTRTYIQPSSRMHGFKVSIWNIFFKNYTPDTGTMYDMHTY